MSRQTLTHTYADGTRGTYHLQPGSAMPMQIAALKPMKKTRVKADKRVFPKYKPGMSTADYVRSYEGLNQCRSGADYWQTLNTDPASMYQGIDSVETIADDDTAPAVDLAAADPVHVDEAADLAACADDLADRFGCDTVAQVHELERRAADPAPVAIPAPIVAAAPDAAAPGAPAWIPAGVGMLSAAECAGFDAAAAAARGPVAAPPSPVVAASTCTPPPVVAASAQEPAAAYSLPRDTYADWSGHQARGWVPNDRQALVMRAVSAALASGLYYTKDVHAYCLQELRPCADDAARGAQRVEGGEFGMDCYYARSAIKAKKAHADEAAAATALRLQPGAKLGTLMFSDLKLTHCAEVAAVSDDGLHVTLTGKRGANTVRLECSAISVRYAIERAHERGKRRDSFEEYCAGRPAPAAPDPAPAAPAPLPPVAAIAQDSPLPVAACAGAPSPVVAASASASEPASGWTPPESVDVQELSAEDVRAWSLDRYSAEFDALTEVNAHSEAVALEALRHGAPEHVAEALAIVAAHNAAGCLTPELNRRRRALVDAIASLQAPDPSPTPGASSIPAPRELAGPDVVRMMRAHGRTIADLAIRLGVTQARVRQVRAQGVRDAARALDWIEAITGRAPVRDAAGAWRISGAGPLLRASPPPPPVAASGRLAPDAGGILQGPSTPVAACAGDSVEDHPAVVKARERLERAMSEIGSDRGAGRRWFGRQVAARLKRLDRARAALSRARDLAARDGAAEVAARGAGRLRRRVRWCISWPGPIPLPLAASVRLPSPHLSRPPGARHRSTRTAVRLSGWREFSTFGNA